MDVQHALLALDPTSIFWWTKQRLWKCHYFQIWFKIFKYSGDTL